MSATVNIIINAIDNTSPALSGVKTSFTELSSAIGLVKQVVGEVQRAFDQTVGITVEYAKRVRDLGRNIGQTTEETSRLIQVADDYGIEVGTLTASLQMAVRRGIVPNIETLAQLADTYKSTTDPIERARILTEKFGRGWMALTPMLDAGGDAIREAAQGIGEGLIITAEAAQQARDYEIATDTLNDTVLELKVSLGKELLPEILKVLDAMNRMVTGTGTVQKAFDDINKKVRASGETYEQYSARMDALRESLNQLPPIARRVVENLPEFTKMTREEWEAVEATWALYDAIEASEEGWQEVNRLMRNAGYAKVASEIDVYEEAMQAAIDAQGRLGVSMEDVQFALQGPIAGAYANYQEQIAGVRERMAGVATEIQTAIAQGYSPMGRYVRGLAENLVDLYRSEETMAAGMAEATKQIVYQKAMMGLDATASLELGRALGLISESDYNLATTLEALKAQYDTSTTEGLAKYTEGVKLLAEASADGELTLKETEAILKRLDGQTVNTELNVSVTGDQIPPILTGGGAQGATYTPPQAYQTGGQFVVPPTYGREGFPLGNIATASAGETITVTPAGQRAGATVTMYNTFNVTNEADARLAARAIAAEIERMG